MYRSLVARSSKCTHLPSLVRIPKAYQHTSVNNQYDGSHTPGGLFVSQAPSTRNGNFPRKPSFTSAQSSSRRSPAGQAREMKSEEFLAMYDYAPESLKPSELWPYLRKNIRAWAERHTVHDRLVSYGLPSEDIEPLLTAFSDYLEEHDIFVDLDFTEEQVQVIAEDLSDPTSNVSTDVQFTRLLYEWASLPRTQAALHLVCRLDTTLNFYCRVGARIYNNISNFRLNYHHLLLLHACWCFTGLLCCFGFLLCPFRRPTLDNYWLPFLSVLDNSGPGR